MSSKILETIFRENRNGKHCGIYSVCSANKFVLEAAAIQAQADGSPLLIEATCNQANQEGGYTGMTPKDFHTFVTDIVAKLGFPTERLILGGDHLGPSPWVSLPAQQAMDRAVVMVQEYVKAGFTKIHLDASMPCADDVLPLPDEVIAARAAQLCSAAESVANPSNLPIYIIGTEVPVPGGAQEELDELEVTHTDDLASTVEMHRHLFIEQGLEAAWQRVVAVVVQPGVEFDHASVVDYDPARAKALSGSVLNYDRIVFEAHSTDYQKEAALSDLVRDHFAILKVGPALTFALREAIFRLGDIEQELITEGPLSNIRHILEQQMINHPKYWEAHYNGNHQRKALSRKYSFSDRSRYYWNDPLVEESVRLLIRNLTSHTPPMTLLSQYIPVQYQAIRQGKLENTPKALLHHSVRQVLSEYARACGTGTCAER